MKCTSAYDRDYVEKKQTSYEGEVGSWLGKIHRFCLNKRLWDV